MNRIKILFALRGKLKLGTPCPLIWQYSRRFHLSMEFNSEGTKSKCAQENHTILLGPCVMGTSTLNIIYLWFKVYNSLFPCLIDISEEFAEYTFGPHYWSLNRPFSLWSGAKLFWFVEIIFQQIFEFEDIDFYLLPNKFNKLFSLQS